MASTHCSSHAALAPSIHGAEDTVAIIEDLHWQRPANS
jgi:hypothetical protein